MTSFDNLIPPLAATGGVFALGNFDGVHQGHQAILTQTATQARALGVPSRVLTFEPHPRVVFWPDHAPFRLTSSEQKERLIKACGIDAVVTLPFTLELAQVSAEDFAYHVLCNRLKAQHIVAGFDFTFGYKRGGDMAKLAAWLAPHKIGVTKLDPQKDQTGEVYSSTRIRDYLHKGEVEHATHLLGRHWAIAGTVLRGAQRGRTIGVPTANIALGDMLRPKFGVYGVHAGRVGEAMALRGVANIGIRPTVDGKSETLEAHLFDFDTDIYGQEWQFALTHFIREERKFENIDLLKQQIQKDIVAARKLA